jgi:hypothetical protein
MKKKDSLYVQFFKHTQIPIKYVLLIIMIFIIAELLANFYGTKKQKEFYLTEINGNIRSVGKDMKGFYLIEVNDSRYNLSFYGACIDSLLVGDHIVKSANSFIFYIKEIRQEGKTKTYECFQNKKLIRKK